jgi:NAD-dependent deacetylase
VVGTSLAVYPAAGLLHNTKPEIPIFVIDPASPQISGKQVTFIREKAGKGVELLKKKLENFR